MASPVPFEEIDTPRISLNGGTLTGVRTFKINFGDTNTFMSYLWGAYTNSSGQISVKTPVAWPGISFLFVQDVNAEAFDPQSPLGQQPNMNLETDVSQFQFAKVTATYRPWPPDNTPDGKPSVPSGTYLDYEEEDSSEMLTVAGRQFIWSGGVVGKDSLPDEARPGILIPCQDITLTWHRVAKPPYQAIHDTIGSVNDNGFLGWDDEMVLFCGAHIDYEFQIGNGVLYKIAYKFKVKSVQGTASTQHYGWNHFYRSEGLSSGQENWTEIVDSTTGNNPYNFASFDDLFQYG